MPQVIEALKYVANTKEYLFPRKLFLSGGIRGEKNWQDEIIELLKDEKMVFFNPRGKDINWDVPKNAQDLAEWEFNHIRLATEILFWLDEGSDSSAMLEIGQFLTKNVPIYIGISPEYKGGIDVKKHIKLLKPDFKVSDSLSELAQQVKDRANSKGIETNIVILFNSEEVISWRKAHSKEAGWNVQRISVDVGKQRLIATKIDKVNGKEQWEIVKLDFDVKDTFIMK